jgi:hypothetical protein
MEARKIAGLFLSIYGTSLLVVNLLSSFLMDESINTWAELFIHAMFLLLIGCLTILLAIGGILFVVAKTKRRSDIVAGSFLFFAGSLFVIAYSTQAWYFLGGPSIAMFIMGYTFYGYLGCLGIASVLFMVMRSNSVKTRVAGLFLLLSIAAFFIAIYVSMLTFMTEFSAIGDLLGIIITAIVDFLMIGAGVLFMIDEILV